jgi:peptide subunit release factor 1 (eRF1)
MSITREEIRELAEFQDQGGCALSFYFQPSVPRNKAHKEETILAKDLAREALRRLESKGNPDCARGDLDRILRLTGDFRSNGVHAKAIFACAAMGFWREYDLPAQLGSTQLFVDRNFHLKPLVHLLGALPNLWVVLLDRHRARLFDLRLGELTERVDLFHPLSRRGRSDGFAGYDAGHAQRRVDEEVRQHFKSVAESLKHAQEKNLFEKWILGCSEIHWSHLQPQLHPYVVERLLGRFSADVGHVTADEVGTNAERIFTEWQQQRRHQLVQEAMNQARGNARGVTGLRRVLRSLELGEVQTLFVAENYSAEAVECAACGHLDAHLVSFCPVCGRATRNVVDVAEAILPLAIHRDVELFYVKDDPEFDRVGNIAALLRYRSDQSANVGPISVLPAGRSPRVRSVQVGRSRGFAS